LAAHAQTIPVIRAIKPHTVEHCNSIGCMGVNLFLIILLNITHYSVRHKLQLQRLNDAILVHGFLKYV